MLNKLLPQPITHHYTGYRIAQWVFILITVMTIARSLLHMFLPDGGAQSIATIPLNTFSHNAAATVILLMALWGSSQLLMGIFYLIVLWRYQSLIPLMYLFIFAEYSLRMFFMHIKPIYITGTAPGHLGDFIMVPLALIMGFLSLKKRV